MDTVYFAVRYSGDFRMEKTAFSQWVETRTARISQLVDQALPCFQEFFGQSRLSTPADLDVLDNGLVFDQDSAGFLRSMWFHVLEHEGGRTYRGYRAVHLLQLSLIPMDVRNDQGALAKMRIVLRGLYGAEVEVVYLAAGIYHPRRLGIVQLYGSVGRGESFEQAEKQALNSAAALKAAMSAAYPQIRFSPVDMEMAHWLDEALKNMPHCLLAVGQPDPRENIRGGFSELTPLLTSGKPEQNFYTLQQNELVMRGMSQLEEDFLLQILLAPVSMGSASQMLAGLAEYTSTWAAWQTGNRSFNFGVALPLLLSGALARSVGTGYTRSQSETAADGVSSMESVAHSDGQANSHTVGHAHTVGSSVTETEGISVVESHEISTGKNHSLALGESQSRAVTNGTNQSRSVSDGSNSFASVSAGVNGSLGAPGVASVGGSVSGTVGGGTSHSVTGTTGSSHAVTQAQGWSQVETFGESSGEAHGVSVAHSQSRSVGHMVSDTEMESNTATTSQTDTRGSAEGTSHVDANSSGTSLARGLSQGLSQAISVGLAPSVSFGDVNQWQFDPALLLTAILRKQQDLLNVITKEGGFYTDVYALTSTERGKRALMALLPEAFHGVEDVITGVQTRTLTPDEDHYIRKHAMAMVPSTRQICFPEAMTAYAELNATHNASSGSLSGSWPVRGGHCSFRAGKDPGFCFRP